MKEHIALTNSEIMSRISEIIHSNLRLICLLSTIMSMKSRSRSRHRSRRILMSSTHKKIRTGAQNPCPVFFDFRFRFRVRF